MELTITTVMIAVILVIAPVVILKKAVKPKTNVNEHLYIALCEDKCIYAASNSILIDARGKYEKYDYVRHSGETYEIHLVGGGGASSKYSPGGVGEFKTIKMHSLNSNISDSDLLHSGILTGYYLLEAGKGGEEGKSGKPSRFCVITEDMANKKPDKISCDDSRATILAQAMGGITSNEEELDYPNQGNGEKTDNPFRTTGCAFGQYGWGGCKKETSKCKKKGQDGVVIIK